MMILNLDNLFTTASHLLTE